MSIISISAAVGINAANRNPDVTKVQVLLNHFIGNRKLLGAKPLVIDGKCGSKTREAIMMLQIQNGLISDEHLNGQIRPGGMTIAFMNKNAGYIPPDPGATKKPEQAPKKEPGSRVRALWPKSPTTKGRFTSSGKKTNIVPPEVAMKLPIASHESDVHHFGYLALKFSIEGDAEVKAWTTDKAKVKGSSLASKVGSGQSIKASDGGSMGVKAAIELSEKAKFEVESSWSQGDMRAFEEAVSSGEIEKLGKELAAAKINYSFFEGVEGEVSVSPDFPCLFAIQGKFNLSYSWLLKQVGAPPNELANPPDAKVELAGTLHFGPGRKAWVNISKRIGKEAFEKIAQRLPSLASGLSKFVARLNIWLAAVEFVAWEIALFNYLVEKAIRDGDTKAYIWIYTQAYAFTVADCAHRLQPLPTEEGRLVREAGKHDARKAVRTWGKRAVAQELIDIYGDMNNVRHVVYDPYLVLKDDSIPVDGVSNAFGSWLIDNYSRLKKEFSFGV